MSSLVLEPMNDAAKWTASKPDGVTPSSELLIHDDPTMAHHGPDAISARITATSSAVGHVLRRTLAPVGVSSFSELRLALRGDRRTRGADEPFFLELRLGSAALPLGDPANAWHRLLPLVATQRWETVKIGIDDLPPSIAAALSQVELRCVDADPPFTVNLDDMIVARPEMVADVDRALEARLSGISIAAGSVAATVRAAAEAKPAAPALDLMQVDIRYAPTRVRDAVEPRDYTADGGLRLVPVGAPYDLYYSVTAVAAKRGDQAALVDAVLSRLEPFDALRVHGDELTLDIVRMGGRRRVSGVVGAEPVLFFKVGARQVGIATPRSARLIREITFDADYQHA